MNSDIPSIIAINHDDYHAKHIGHTTDGKQFFLTTPFVPAGNGQLGNEFIALYIFNRDGELLDAQIDNLGPRSNLDNEKAHELYKSKLASLGKVKFDRIEIAPFSISRYGVEFGLLIREPDDTEDPIVVELQPGNSMAFYEPWDSGEYDT